MKTFLPPLLCLLALTAIAQTQDGLRKINGASLYVATIGTGENLVVVHGGPGLSHDYLRPHVDDLAKDFQLIYFDQRACGRSSIPGSDSISIKFLVDDLEGLRKEMGIDKVNLLAHSWGAVLATHYALAYPDRIAKLVYSNPSTLSREYDSEIRNVLQERATESYQRAVAAFGNTEGSSPEKFGNFYKEVFKLSAYDTANITRLDLKLRDDYDAANNALRGLYADPAMAINLYERIGEFKFPVLIIAGKADMHPMDALTRLANTIPGARLTVLERSGHFPFVEEKEAYLELITTFLKK